MRAVFLDAQTLSDLDLAPIKNAVSALTIHEETAPEDVESRITDAEIIIVNKVKLSREVLEKAKALKLICLVATGKDNVDCVAAQALGITVCNCQNYGTDSVVQHVFSCILALHTGLIQYNEAVKKGRWQAASQFCFLDFPIIELRGKTLGIIGMGTLGSGVAEVAKAFGMKILVGAVPGREGEGKLPLNEFLPQVDVLSIHCPLSDASRNMIDGAAMAKMKQSAFLINAARGGIVDEAALATALRTGQIAGAATDVLSVEPPKAGNALLAEDIPNLIITPHCAWGSDGARNTIIAQTSENITGFKAGAPLRIVNN